MNVGTTNISFGRRRGMRVSDVAAASGPTIDDVDPSPVLAGLTMTITGTDFGTVDEITVGSAVVPSASITSATATEIVCQCPTDAASGSQTLTVTFSDADPAETTVTVDNTIGAHLTALRALNPIEIILHDNTYGLDGKGVRYTVETGVDKYMLDSNRAIFYRNTTDDQQPVNLGDRLGSTFDGANDRLVAQDVTHLNNAVSDEMSQSYLGTFDKTSNQTNMAIASANAFSGSTSGQRFHGNGGTSEGIGTQDKRDASSVVETNANGVTTIEVRTIASEKNTAIRIYLGTTETTGGTANNEDYGDFGAAFCAIGAQGDGSSAAAFTFYGRVVFGYALTQAQALAVRTYLLGFFGITP